MAEKKMTKREVLNALIAGTLSQEEVIAFAEHELELLDRKKKSSSSKSNIDPTEVQMMYDLLTDHPEGIQIKNFILAHEELKDYTSSKVQPRLKVLVEKGVVMNFKVKGASLYKVVDKYNG